MSDRSVLMTVTAQYSPLLPVTTPIPLWPFPFMSLSHCSIKINSIIHNNVPQAQRCIMKIDAPDQGEQSVLWDVGGRSLRSLGP